MTTEKDREDARKILDHIYSLHGFISQKDSRTRQMTKQAVMERKKEREAALIEVLLAYHSDSSRQARREAATFEEIKEWLIGKSGSYKSEYIQASIIMLREMFDGKRAILAAPTESEPETGEERDERLALKQELGAGCHDEWE